MIPIVFVVAAFKPGPGKVGNLVLVEPVFRHGCKCCFVHRGIFFFRQWLHRSLLHHCEERRMLFNDQAVRRYMFWLQCDCTAEVFLPSFKRLVRQGKNQVDAHVVETGAVCVLDACSCFVGVCECGSGISVHRMEGLNADAQPVDAERPVSSSFSASTVPGFVSTVISAPEFIW